MESFRKEIYFTGFKNSSLWSLLTKELLYITKLSQILNAHEIFVYVFVDNVNFGLFLFISKHIFADHNPLVNVKNY